MVTEVKLELKKPLINYDKKPIKNTDSIRAIKNQNPSLTDEQLIKKCPNATFGNVLPPLLVQVPSQDPVEKLKLFRWASKISDEMITDKAELSLDINQITELYDFITKVPGSNIITIAPILIYLEELKERLNTG